MIELELVELAAFVGVGFFLGYIVGYIVGRKVKN